MNLQKMEFGMILKQTFHSYWKKTSWESINELLETAWKVLMNLKVEYNRSNKQRISTKTKEAEDEHENAVENWRFEIGRGKSAICKEVDENFYRDK